jgi:hypothetical protein
VVSLIWSGNLLLAFASSYSWFRAPLGPVIILFSVRPLSCETLEWSASRPTRFTPGERAPGTHWVGRWVGSKAVLDAVEERISLPLPGTEFHCLRPSSPLPVATRTELTRGSTLCTTLYQLRKLVLIHKYYVDNIHRPVYITKHTVSEFFQLT